MNYTFNQLTIFMKVVETESITKTAEELHLSQPAVSIQLRNFQLNFKTALTEVVGRKLYITDFGREVAQSAARILETANELENKESSLEGKLTGLLKLSVVSTGKYVIPYFLTEFLNANTNVELKLDVSNKARVIETLERNEVDFALVSVLPAHLHLKKVELMENSLHLIGGKAYPSATAPVPKKQLESLPFIYREQGSATRQAMERFIMNNKLNISKKIELTTNEAVKQAVIAGLGCSIMPLIGLKNELRNGQVHIIPVKGLPIRTSWNLVWMADKKLSPVASAFLDYVRKEKEQVIRSYFNWIKT